MKITVELKKILDGDVWELNVVDLPEGERRRTVEWCATKQDALHSIRTWMDRVERET